MRTVLAFGIAALITSSAQANVTMYDNEAAYHAALGVTVVNSFETAVLVPGLSVSPSVNIYQGQFTDSPRTNGGGTTFTFANGTYGFGGIFDETPGDFGSGLLFSINGTTAVSELNGAKPGTFYGFISNTAFSSVLVSAGTALVGQETYFLNNLEFSGSAVPEPSSWALMIGGFGMIGAAMRRRTKLFA